MDRNGNSRMVEQTSEQSETIELLAQIEALKKENANLLEQLVKEKVEEEVYVRNKSPRERDGFLRMVSLGIFANLYNSSPGRDPQSTAKLACVCAEALWEEWIKRK